MDCRHFCLYNSTSYRISLKARETLTLHGSEPTGTVRLESALRITTFPPFFDNFNFAKTLANPAGIFLYLRMLKVTGHQFGISS